MNRLDINFDKIIREIQEHINTQPGGDGSKGQGTTSPIFKLRWYANYFYKDNLDFHANDPSNKKA